ncbi:hypothetical protein HII13_003776 [Brettanomyces bruxellensis]|uniref:DEBR0S1_21550g1_1 n=1 Tax=Dekkera bruxellensis TaxID=5007 RepID=A0A7D9GZA9_DEKBR|nr:hypothetical protein HII13_003776 [Brettanomyces bruxellensis]VUG16628.1 DEBR0S1_21550g1_1 [Brettanomyces bruxellensis]
MAEVPIMSRSSKGELRSGSGDKSFVIGESNFKDILNTAESSDNNPKDVLEAPELSNSSTSNKVILPKVGEQNIQDRSLNSSFNADDTFDTSKFYEMFSSKELQSDINSSPGKLSRTSFSSSSRCWNNTSLPVTPERAKSVGNLLFQPFSRVGFNSTHNLGTEHNGLRISGMNKFSRFFDSSVDDSAISDQLLRPESAGIEYASPVSLSSSPGPWQPPSFSNGDTGRRSSTFAQKSRFFPNKQAELRTHNTLILPSTSSNDPMSLESLEASLPSLPVQKRIGSTNIFSGSSSPLSLAMVPEFHPARESLRKAKSFENFNLEPSMNSAHQAAANVLGKMPEDEASPTPNGYTSHNAEIKNQENGLPQVNSREVESFRETEKHPRELQTTRYTEVNTEIEDKEGQYQKFYDNIELSLPKIPYSERSRLPSCPSILKYIRSIITRQPTQYMVYIASLPYDTPTSQCHELIAQAFNNFGEVTSAVKDEHSRWSKVAPEKDIFIRYRIVAKLFNDQRTPYKSHRFFNEVTGRDSKMLLFFDYSSSSPNGRLEKGNPFGYSKQDLSSYPEGFSSTFHKRGLNNFMFVRELQSKMIISKVRLSNTITIDSAEFRVSLPIEELGLSLDSDSHAADDENRYLEDGRNSYRRIRRSYVVSIDVRDLENRPGYYYNGKFGSTDHSGESNVGKNSGNSGKSHYNTRINNRNYNKKK